MGVRKNAKFLTTVEIENFVKACVHMKADIINPGAPANQLYSKWDEFVAVHWMIQQASAPGAANVNFGHGASNNATGAYSFLSWHRYFLFQFENELRTYFPGDDVRLPYWDWTDPGSIMTDIFIGPDGTGTGNVIRQGYFAVNKPGTAPNITVEPPWWPPSLNGWRLPGIFGSTNSGGLRRNTGNPANLPSVTDIQQTLDMGNYEDFQQALENGEGAIASATRMHNDMHNWVGGGGHMNNGTVSPFDPFFYLVHCNVDRLWAMWQMDGHATEYPNAGGNPHHHRNDLMYPWIGGAVGYGTNASIAGSVPMPTWVIAAGAQENVDTLNFRNLGYTYDTIPIIGIGLDRTGSMLGLTPDPMVNTDPDVTKWEAAKRGVSAFLQDAETAQASGAIYMMAGIKTFRSFIGNEFTPVFGAPNFGLIKTGSSFSKNSFDANIAPMTPGGGTPLADALLDVQNTLVEAPFGGDPSDEQRYLALLTDGLLTTGAPMNSIPNGSFTRTTVFTMGFGTGADVDYPTLTSMAQKGTNFSLGHIFHGETAGTIDKFFTNSLAEAIGFTTVFDPVIELFAGEHTHLYYDATSADDAFLITAQGMDFKDRNWHFMLHAPNGEVLFGSDKSHEHEGSCHHCCPTPHITSNRSDGRLTLIVQRGSTGKDCWVGRWELMISYKTEQLNSMLMLELGELLFPVSAGVIRGPRYSRLLNQPVRRVATRSIFTKSQHGLDIRAVSTNRSDNDACNMVVNFYARTNLKIEMDLEALLVKPGEEIKIGINAHATFGSVQDLNGFARMVAPAFGIAELLPRDKVDEIIRKLEDTKRDKDGYKDKKRRPELDIALILARLEKEKDGLQFIKDAEIPVVSHEGGPLHIHVQDTQVPGTYHFGIYVEGTYSPNAQSATNSHGHGHGNIETPAMDHTDIENFSRLINISVGVVNS